MRSYFFLAAIAVTLTAVAAEVADRKQFAPLKFKSSDLESTSIESSISWDGPRRSANARAMLFVGQFVGDAKDPLSSVVVFMNLEQAKQLQQRLGEIVKEMEK